jgi:CheY-specific phosphatase CheX
MIPRAVICSTLDRVLEAMYFCEAAPAGPGIVRAAAVGAVVSFSGSRSGELRILATLRLARQLVTDFLAAENGEIGETQTQSMLYELANVMCGAVLGEWMPEGNFKLSVPRMLEVNDSQRHWPHRFCVIPGDVELAVELEQNTQAGNPE